MATNVPDLSAFLNPHLCANTQRIIDEVVAPCEKDAALACGGCDLVQVSVFVVYISARANERSTAPKSVSYKTDRTTRRHANPLF
jgi:hypothetical protein